MVSKQQLKKYINGLLLSLLLHLPLLKARILAELLSFSFPEAGLEFKNSQDCKSECVPLFQAYFQFLYSSHSISGSTFAKKFIIIYRSSHILWIK